MNSHQSANRCIFLQASDGLLFSVDIKIAKSFGIIESMLECVTDFDDTSVIPLKEVSSHILHRILTWAEHHKDDPPNSTEESHDNSNVVISEWDANFLNVDQGRLFELILAANYLDIKGLLKLTCKSVANLVQHKSPDQIRNTFNIADDFSAEQKEQLRKEREWCGI